MLEIEGLSVSYGHSRAVIDVDLVAPVGAITIITGPNGAGKSSLIRAINGSVPSTGRVVLDGQELSGRAGARLRAGVGIVPQGRQIFPRLTVLENLQLMVRASGCGPEAVDQAMERFPILAERSRSLAGVLSGGEQQMLAVGRALMSRPRVLLLDEMATGLAPRIVETLLDTAVDLAREGAIVVMAEPSLTVTRGVYDGGVVLRRGEIVEGYVSGHAALEDLYHRALGLSVT